MMAREATPTGPFVGRVDPSVLARVEDLFRAMARRVRMRLVNRCSTEMLVRFGTADMAPFGTLLDRYRSQEGAAFGRVRLGPGDMSGLVVMDAGLRDRVVGLMLGEAPDYEGQSEGWRVPTALDLRLARRVVEDCMVSLVESIPASSRWTAHVELISGTLGLGIPLQRGAMVVEASLDFGPPEGPYGLISFLFPAELIRAWWPTRPLRDVSRPASDEGMSRILPLPVTLAAELGRLRMSLSEFRGIRPGTLLEVGPARDVQVRIGERVVLSAEPGEQNGYRSVRVRHRIDAHGLAVRPTTA